MRQTADPDFELSWRAALWAAATLTVVTGVGIVLYSNLRLFGYGTMLAGLVASLCCGYYEHASNSAVVGVVLVSLVVLGVGDALFVTTSFGLAWLAVVAIVFLPVAYLSATVGDFARKKVGGRIGYNT
jgi:hypothetical protein